MYVGIAKTTKKTHGVIADVNWAPINFVNI